MAIKPRLPLKRSLAHKFITTAMAVVVMLLVFSGLAEAALNYFYRGQIFPGVRVANVTAGKLTTLELRNILQEKFDYFSQTGITYKNPTRQITLPLTIVGTTASPDLAYSWADIDIEQTINQALAYGRHKLWLINLWQKITALLYNTQLPAVAQIDETRLRLALAENFNRDLKAAQPVKVTINGADIKFTQAQPGQRWDYEDNVQQTKYLIENLTSGIVNLTAINDDPPVKKEDLAPEIISQTKRIINSAPWTLKYEGQQWVIDNHTLASWLGFTKTNGQVVIGWNKTTLEDYFLNEITININRGAQAMKFSITNGKVTEFQPATDGRQVNLDETINKLDGLLTQPQTDNQTEIVVDIQPAPISDQANITNIKELVGVGRSNFAGSPANRRHNIAVGAAAVNGTIIQPGEEFSLLKTLGTVDAAAGYKPELVIKGDKTVPEFGGGLCQIGTTSFRVALATGVPIIERRNHSYRVTYYEPAGTDATIYDPAPDFRFTNDYAAPLLFQTKIQGNDLIFELWGIKDGRLATQTKPIISNIKLPPPKKIVETLDLKPGETKCTEKPHNGANTTFTYTVTYPDGETKETEFRSHYVPWQEVCLLGVTTLSSSSTTSTVPESPPVN